MSILQSSAGQQMIFFGSTFFMTAISFICFTHCSLVRIEKEMKQEGLPHPAPWDGIGVRTWFYAYFIVVSGVWNKKDHPFIDVSGVRRHAKPLDKKLGLALLICSALFVVAVCSCNSL